MLVNKARRGLEKLIAPSGHLSYAQAGDDLVLDFLVGHRPSGFYVDCGCNHPRHASNTYRFYRKGWHGVCIDAAAKFAPLYKRYRPRDRFVRAAVSDQPGNVTFHHFKSDALSSIGGERLADVAGYEPLTTEVMATRPLSDILAENDVPIGFDILSVDVEGHDEAVLRSAALAHYQPEIIVTELNGTDLDIGRVSEHAVSRMLSALGYQPIAVHWGNVFYRR